MNTSVKAEKYIKKWCRENGRKFAKKHGKECEGCDLIVQDKNENIFIEAKGSTKEKFMDVRPYIRMDQLKLALEKGKNYEFHILLGFKDRKPKEHYIFSGQNLTGYKECIDKCVGISEEISGGMVKV
jgi:hypothetical protein